LISTLSNYTTRISGLAFLFSKLYFSIFKIGRSFEDLSREVIRSIQEEFDKPKISEARHRDLLGEADINYPRYLALLVQLNE